MHFHVPCSDHRETTQPYSLGVRDILQRWEFGTLQVLVEQQSCVLANSLLAPQVRLNGARVYDLEEGKYYSALLEKKKKKNPLGWDIMDAFKKVRNICQRLIYP